MLAPFGVLVFTTHGRQSHLAAIEHPEYYGLEGARRRRILRDYERVGFGYVDYPDHSGYGISLAEPAWVCRLVMNIKGLRLVGLNEKSWDNHQDVCACVRDDAWCASAPRIRSTADRSSAAAGLGYRELMARALRRLRPAS
jgi:hypothetical protein